MPICKKCDNQFPNRITIDGKEKYLNSRSYCLDCSPFGTNTGQKLKSKRMSGAKTFKLCPTCNRKFPWSKNSVCSTCRNTYARYKNKLNLVEHLGGKCSECSESHISCLDFHHQDDELKDFSLAQRMHYSYSDLLKEAEKCILLCANCHRKEHHKDKTVLVEYYK